MKNNNTTQGKINRHKEVTGVIRSAKMDKTVIVEVEHMFRHPLYKKSVRRTKRYAVHYEGQDVSVGDTVKITETRPISKTKHFILSGKRI